MQFSFNLKLPNLDPFYFRQAAALKRLHASAINLSSELFGNRNPQEAYDPEFGRERLRAFGVLVRGQKALKLEAVNRILRRRTQGRELAYKSELDRDIIRSEVLQQNIEEEMTLLHSKVITMLIIGTLIAAYGILVLLASTHLPEASPPSPYPLPVSQP